MCPDSRSVAVAAPRERWLYRAGSRSGVSGALASPIVAPAATADPKGTAIASNCDDGTSIQLVSAGNGDFTPGHLVGGRGTQVYVVRFVHVRRSQSRLRRTQPGSSNQGKWPLPGSTSTVAPRIAAVSGV